METTTQKVCLGCNQYFNREKEAVCLNCENNHKVGCECDKCVPVSGAFGFLCA